MGGPSGARNEDDEFEDVVEFEVRILSAELWRPFDMLVVAAGGCNADVEETDDDVLAEEAEEAEEADDDVGGPLGGAIPLLERKSFFTGCPG